MSLFLFSLHHSEPLRFSALMVVVPLLSMEGQKALRFHQKYLNLCSEDERRSYRFGVTWGWVINDRIFTFGWTIPLSSWTVSESERASIYCIQFRQHSGSDCNLYFLLMRRLHSVWSSVSCYVTERQWAGPMVRTLLFVDVLLRRRCLCKCLCPSDVILHLRSKRAVWSLI